VTDSTVPVVIDADALQTEIIEAGKCPKILTPHAGEFARIAGGRESAEVAKSCRGHSGVERTCDAGERWHCGVFFTRRRAGVGARRVGDLLAGMIGARVAQAGVALLDGVCLGVLLARCGRGCTREGARSSGSANDRFVSASIAGCPEHETSASV